MADRGASALSLPEDRPAPADPILTLNRMGTFDWDLETGLFHLDAQAHEVFDLLPEEYDGHVESLSVRVPEPEGARLDAVVSRAIKNCSENYGAYFRIRCRDGSSRWTHAQGYIRRDVTGRPRRIVGIVRDATEELAESAARSLRAAQDEALRQQTDIVQVISAALAHARSVRDVIDAVKNTHGVRHLGAASLVMGLVEAGRIRVVAEGPDTALVPGTRITRTDEPYPMSEVVRTLSPRFIESPEEFAAGYPILWPRLTGLRVTSAAYPPLIAQARAIGAMGLLYSDRRGFSAEERAVLVALGSSIAQSLQRAMLYEQEKDLAQGLQQAMPPRTIPSVRGADIAVRYRAAALGRDIGGAWYDLIPLPGGASSGGGRVGAVIGDVQGHDTHAAAVMGRLRIVLRAYAAEGHSPAAVMARASVFLHELDTDRFATCLYAEADLATGVVQMVRAGHIDPLIRNTESGTQKRLAVYVVRDLVQVPGIARLGPDLLAAGFDEARLAALLKDERRQLKGALRDQSLIAGIGNAYSDEILHAAKMSPFKLAASLTPEETHHLYEALHNTLNEAVERSRGLAAGRLEAEKKTGLRVHGRTGEPCPVCGDAIREVFCSDSSLQYCPTCQTGGKLLADRRLSRLLK